MDRMRAEVTTWWQDFPERQLLTDLYRRAARRKAKCGSADSRRDPPHDEGVRVARGLLAHIPDTGPWDYEWEYAAVSTVLAALLLPPIGTRSRPALRAYINLSRSSRVFFDALRRICGELDRRDEAIPPMLARWRTEAAGGHRRRPAGKPRPSRRPVRPALLRRDLKIQLTIEVLDRVGVPPRGRDVSGCRIAKEALEPSEDDMGLSEDSVLNDVNHSCRLRDNQLAARETVMRRCSDRGSETVKNLRRKCDNSKCGQLYGYNSATSKYCGRSCQNKVYRERKAEKDKSERESKMAEMAAELRRLRQIEKQIEPQHDAPAPQPDSPARPAQREPKPISRLFPPPADPPETALCDKPTAAAVPSLAPGPVCRSRRPHAPSGESRRRVAPTPRLGHDVAVSFSEMNLNTRKQTPSWST